MPWVQTGYGGSEWNTPHFTHNVFGCPETKEETTVLGVRCLMYHLLTKTSTELHQCRKLAPQLWRLWATPREHVCASVHTSSMVLSRCHLPASAWAPSHLTELLCHFLLPFGHPGSGNSSSWLQGRTGGCLYYITVSLYSAGPLASKRSATFSLSLRH